MEANHAYVLRKCVEFGVTGQILDYGCGNGDIVEVGRARGLNIMGVDSFYSASNAREVVEARRLFGSSVVELGADGVIPFGDESFSLVFSNQVFEHVTDLDFVLREIFRVLVPGGILLALFPSRDVWREGHCGIPFAHWFRPGSSLRYPYMRLMRGIGLGHHKANKTHDEWARHKIAWLDRFTVYRSYAEIVSSLAKVADVIEPIEDDYIAYRLGRTKLAWAASMLTNRLTKRVAQEACRKYAGRVLVARKPQRSSAARN